MPDEALIRQILEHLMESGGTAEDACRDHPELLQEVRRQWHHVRAVMTEVEKLFPSREDLGGAMDGRPPHGDCASGEQRFGI